MSIAAGCEWGLGIALFAVPGLLAMIPHGVAPLVGLAGLCAIGLVLARHQNAAFPGLRYFAVLLSALVLWGGLSAAWAISPYRSLLIDARLIGLFASAVALAAAGACVAAPRRLFAMMLAGTALALVLAGIDVATEGGLSRFISARPFEVPRLNQLAVWAAIMMFPAAALSWSRGERALALATGVVLAATVLLLQDTTAKLALAASLPAGVAMLFWRRGVARVAAVVSVVAILGAPLVLPRLAHDPAIFGRVDAFKESAGHRLLIWAFVGDRIAEHPLRGWGLDTSRAIPGGKVEIRPGETWLPLHPHNSALQLWLELGLPGAVLAALIVGGLWWRLATAVWPALYAAAAGASLSAAETIAISGWGIWEEWWLATLILALFAVLVMGRGETGTAPASGARRPGIARLLT